MDVSYSSGIKYYQLGADGSYYEVPQPKNAPGNLVRRITIEEYEVDHSTWGSAPTLKHTCPLTDPANAGKVMMYYCPTCHGVQC